jgi:hypothetical protein
VIDVSNNGEVSDKFWIVHNVSKFVGSKVNHDL